MGSTTLPTTQKALVVPSQGVPGEVRDDIPVPEPSSTQVLVKVLYAAINPVDVFTTQLGLLVEAWPFVPGSEASGVVVKAGSDAVSPLGGKFKEGDIVSGCVRLGVAGHGTFAEYFLLDAEVAVPKPKALTLPQAATVAVGALTAFLGIFGELGISIEGIEEGKGQGGGKWIIVFGGAGATGKFAVQALKLAGYKVVTTCSTKSFELVKSLGADATVDYKLAPDEIVEQVKQITERELDLAFDAVSVNNDLVAKIFTAIPSSSGQRLYTTTNDWDPAPDAALGFITKGITLGPIGRPESAELNKKLTSWIPVINRLLGSGKLKPGDYSVEGTGVEGIQQAWDAQKSGKLGNKKVIVKIADE
ncbi:GroES-like protein [Bimuria novae-zelandiae CBS 107.79]|uniref:GroES-like protein n=1 Tax=Bimuria novae-zelandiae CBS 107.79 TaxID=1447943 RepID=A0A6A5VPP2_9PLEO|nr:GroES-like protein [Bimuria novae-zelandiae CBS 107.79]